MKPCISMPTARGGERVSWIQNCVNADDQWCYYSGVRDANCVNTENQWCYYNGVKDTNYVNTDDQWCYYSGVKDANIWEDTILNTNLSKNDFWTIFFRRNVKVIKILWKSCHHAKLPSQNNKIKPSWSDKHIHHYHFSKCKNKIQLYHESWFKNI